jgi:dTDP-4-dehydrorhamnose reductase
MLRVAVSGSSGQLGSILCSLLEEHEFETIRLNRGNFDMANPNSVSLFLRSFEVDVFVNCAAITDVNWAESNHIEANLVNSDSVLEIAQYCSRTNTRLIQISTDFVFDGKKDSPYLITDATNPLSIYGNTKLLGERFVRRILPNDSVILRTGSLYGGNKSNFVSFLRARLEAGTEVSLANNQWIQPTHVTDLAIGIIQIIERTTMDGVFHYTSSGMASKYEFGLEIARRFGLDDSLLKAVNFESLPGSSIRPKYSILDTSDLFHENISIVPPWNESFHKYLG